MKRLFVCIIAAIVITLPLVGCDKGELGERITDDESEHEPAILTDRIALSEAISHMPPLWRKILLIRYFRNRTQQETAEVLGLTQVKVSREEKKILTFLRGEMTV